MKSVLSAMGLVGLLFAVSLQWGSASEPEEITPVQAKEPAKMQDPKVDPNKLPELGPPQLPPQPPPAESDQVPFPVAAPEMLGDVGPTPGNFRPLIFSSNGQQINSSSPSSSTVVAPRLRGFKVSDDESAVPQDRVYFSFNNYSDVFSSTNQALGGGLKSINFSRETFGVEKTFLDGDASVGLRLPLDSFSASGSATAGGTSTAVGDLGIILKYVLWQDRAMGNLVSGGMAVVVPTGPGTFGGYNAATLGLHSTTLQPYVGFLCNSDRFYVQGFSEIDVPMDASDVTLWYNDLGVGYWMYHCSCTEGRLLTAIAPTVELHLTTPLNNRNFPSSTNPAATPDVLNLTGGVNFEFSDRTRFTVGAVVPMTGPKPFNFEVLASVRMRF
jgi:hypothetical protein